MRLWSALYSRCTVTGALLTSALCFAQSEPATPAPDESGRQIMERVNSRPRPPASARRMVLYLKRTGGRRVDREIVAYQTDDGVQTKTLYTVVAPGDMRGLSILRWEGNGEETQWLHIDGLPEPARAAYLDPALPFWGTEFTLGDIRERFQLDAYAFRFKREGRSGGRPCLIVEATVLDKRLGYGRVTGWVDRERWLILKARYRDLRGQVLKVFSADRVRKIGDFWAPHRLTMRNVRTKVTTSFEVTMAKLLQSPPAELFTPAELNAGRGKCYPTPCPRE